MSKGIFSETRGVLEDGLSNAATVDDVKNALREDIRENIVRDGVMMQSDCPYCGLQWKGIVKWPEIYGFFVGQQIPGTQATKGGISLAFGCRKCNHVSPLTIAWDELDRYVARGVKGGFLPPTIYAAREQVLKQRAQQAAAQRAAHVKR